MLPIRLFTAIVVLAVFAAACASAAPAAGPTAQPAGSVSPDTIRLDIKLFSFKPSEIEVPLGATVTWANQDNIGHSITHGTPPDPAGAFDSGFINQTETFSFTFAEPGDYHYFCRRHNSMTGVIKVVEAAR